MILISTYQEQNRRNFNERIKRQIKEAYLNRRDNPKIFLTVNRNALEMMVNDILDDYISELSSDHKDRQLKKQPLDGIISTLQKKDILPSHISAYMHIIRICGNYGTHDQEGGFEESFPMIQDEAMQQLLKWYTGTYLDIGFEFDNVIGEVSRTRFIVHENTTQREKRKKNPVLRVLSYFLKPLGKLLSILLSSFQSVAISLLVIAVIYIILYSLGMVKLPASIGAYVDKLLKLKR